MAEMSLKETWQILKGPLVVLAVAAAAAKMSWEIVSLPLGNDESSNIMKQVVEMSHEECSPDGDLRTLKAHIDSSITVKDLQVQIPGLGQAVAEEFVEPLASSISKEFGKTAVNENFRNFHAIGVLLLRERIHFIRAGQPRSRKWGLSSNILKER